MSNKVELIYCHCDGTWQSCLKDIPDNVSVEAYIDNEYFRVENKNMVFISLYNDHTEG